MIKKKKIPIKSLVLILILVELICLVFAGILGEPGNDINLKTASWMNHPWRCFNQYTLISLGCGLTGWVFFLAFYLDTHRNTHSDIEHGSAEWDDPDTANKRMADLKHPENNRILSKHVNQALSGSKSFPNNNMIVVGAPGTGKSLFVIAPNILKCISSYLFMDPKGELVEKYGNYLQKNGYQIRVLNLKNMESSDRYNPFVYIRTEDDIPRLIMNIFKSVEPPDAQKGDPFWDDGCALYLQSLFYFVWAVSVPDKKKIFAEAGLKWEPVYATQTLNQVTKLMQLESKKVPPRSEDEEESTELSLLIDALADMYPDHPAVRDYRKLKEGAPETVASVLLILNGKFKFFYSKSIQRIFEADDMNLWELGTGWHRDGKSKVALFLVLKENDSSYNFVGNMLYQQLFDELLVEADQNYHGVLPIRVECWMDEFGNGLRPEGFEHLITTLRSRNIAVMLFLQSISQLQTMYKGDGWKVFMDSCAVFLFLGSGRGAYDTQETISKMLGAATIEKASGSVSYSQNGSSSTSYDRLQRSLMDANEVAQMDKDSCIILPFASKPIIDKKYKPFHDPSYLKAKKYGPYTHPVEIFRDKNGNLHTVNHQEKFYFPDEGLQAKIRDDLKEGKSSGMLFELSEDEFCSLDLDDPKLNGPQGNLFLLQQLKKLEDDSATLKLQNAVNEKMNSVIYDTSDNTSSLEADEESAAETISVYDVRQSWDLSGNLEDVIRRYILELSEDEVSNITEAMNRHIPEKKIKDCLTLPPEKLCLMLQFYMKQAN